MRVRVPVPVRRVALEMAMADRKGLPIGKGIHESEIQVWVEGFTL